MINLIWISLLLSSTVFANSSVFYLPNLEANIKRLVELKKKEADPKIGFTKICEKEAMKGKEFMEMVAYQKVTGMDCWEIILENSSKSLGKRVPASEE